MKTYDFGLKFGLRLGAFRPGRFLTEGTIRRDQTLFHGMGEASIQF